MNSSTQLESKCISRKEDLKINQSVVTTAETRERSWDLINQTKMKENKITQKRAVFYILWKAFREDPQQYVPAWKFVGELYIKEIDTHFFMSYKCPTNGLEIFADNPGLVERRYFTGKSGAKYYEYRIAANPSIEKIKEKNIAEFYTLLTTDTIVV